MHFSSADISLTLLLSAVVPVFLIMGLGAALRRFQWLTPQTDGAILVLAMNVTYPCFIIENIVGNKALEDSANVWLPMLCGAVFMIAGGALSWLAAPLFKVKPGAPRRTFALACSIQNYGYLPIPIMGAIFPGGDWMGVLFIYTLGIELVLWSLGVWLMNPHTKGAMRNALNPVTLSIVIGLGLNALLPWWRGWTAGGAAWIFDSIRNAVHLLGACAIPLGLLLVGATLCDLVTKPGWCAEPGAGLGGVVMRLIVLPLTMIGAILLLPVSRDFRHVIAVQAAMPAAVFPMIIARRYGGDEATAMRVIVLTTLVSLVTIPFAVKLLLQWTGG